MTSTDKPLEEAVRAVVDPGLFYSLGELGLLRSVEPQGARTEVVVAEPAAGHPSPHELSEEIEKAVAGAGGAPAEVKFVKLTEAEEDELGPRLRELALTPEQRAGALHAHDGAATRGRRARRQAELVLRQVIAHARARCFLGKRWGRKVDRDREPRRGAGSSRPLGSDS